MHRCFSCDVGGGYVAGAFFLVEYCKGGGLCMICRAGMKRGEVIMGTGEGGICRPGCGPKSGRTHSARKEAEERGSGNCCGEIHTCVRSRAVGRKYSDGNKDDKA